MSRPDDIIIDDLRERVAKLQPFETRVYRYFWERYKAAVASGERVIRMTEAEWGLLSDGGLAKVEGSRLYGCPIKIVEKPEPTEVDCPNCNGAGRIPAGRFPRSCYRCDGSGKVSV